MEKISMSLELALVVTGLGLAILIAFVTLVLRRYNQRLFSVSFAVSHIIFTIVVSAIYFPGEKHAQHELFWILPATFDLPLSLLYPLLACGNMVLVPVAFATLGTVQYAVVGWLIDLVISKDRKQLFPSKRIVIPLAIFLLAAFLWGYKNYVYSKLPAFRKAEIAASHAKTEVERLYALNRAAKDCFEAGEYNKAHNYATELLTAALKYPNDCRYVTAFYNAHIVLGRLALLDGDIEAAKDHLFTAVKTPATEYDPFAPNMTLAKDLLEKGQKKSVIEFLKQCKKFWNQPQIIDEWIKDIQTGRMPDFGMNLKY
jgi:tetratricopeptide (TPR) repeat protein